MIVSAELEHHVTNVAKKIAVNQLLLATGKAAFYAQRELSVADAYDYAARVMVENMLHRDAAEDKYLSKSATRNGKVKDFWG